MIRRTIYRSKPKHEKLWRNVRFVVLLFFLIFFLATAVKTHIDRLDPDGEFGTIDRNTQVTESGEVSDVPAENAPQKGTLDLSSIPEYEGRPTYAINGNKPEFTKEELERARKPFIELSELDALGRCGTNTASLGKEMLDSAGERRDISDISPSGWVQESYPGIIEREGSWLYHRSHLIAHMFAGEDPEIDGEKNLITGTEYCNEEGMLPYAERAVQNWLLRKADGGRVLYRVTPVFVGTELVARGVHIEAADIPKDFKDASECGQKFHINAYCYNVEPGIRIDYLTGRSAAEAESLG